MSWIILALSLGAAITSIIHGVFMLFGSLSVSGAEIFGIPSTLLASLPIISAVLALIGGIIAFNRSKWGALFLFIAMGLCVPSRDTWLYGGVYFFAGLFCFFLKSESQDSYYDYDDYDNEQGEPDFYYDPAIPEPSQEELEREPFSTGFQQDILEGDVSADEALQFNAEPPRVRRRMSKSCPECGAVVSRLSRICPTCGAKLSVMPEDEEIEEEEREGERVELNLNLNQTEDIEKLNNQLLTPLAMTQEQEQEQGQSQENAGNVESEPYEAMRDDNMMNDGDEMSSERKQDAPNFRVTVKPRRVSESRSSANEAASSYREFSRYASKGKKRSRSTSRKVGSMILLIAAVGGAMYFLLGLRKLPPGDLPPMVRTEVVEDKPAIQVVNTEPESEPTKTEIAEPVGIAVSENVLPNFVPEREPKHGIITGNGVNLRADHTTSSARVTKLKSNTRVDVLGTFNVTSGQFSGIWYNIRTGSNEGWVYGRYLQPVGSGLPSGYSAALLKTFGNTRSQLVETLGNPSRSTGSTAEWPGLTATFKGEDVTRIRLTSDSRELQNGLKTGMSQTALLQIMGYPSSSNNRTMNYNEGGKTGLSIQLDRNNSITSITVNEI